MKTYDYMVPTEVDTQYGIANIVVQEEDKDTFTGLYSSCGLEIHKRIQTVPFGFRMKEIKNDGI